MMEYFSLDVHEAYRPPQITKWHGVLDQLTLSEKKRDLIPKYTIFQVNHHMQTVFTDVIMHPCFMVSKKFMDTIKLYETRLRFERIIISDSESKKISAYYIPILEKLDALTKNCRVARDKRTLEYIEIDSKKTKRRSIFKVENNGKIYILVHLDLIESVLSREAGRGIALQEVDTI